MKVYIGPYTNYFGPHQLAEKILFWKDKDEDVVYNFGKLLSNSDLITAICKYIESKRTRTIKVCIDKHDTWSMDHTLAHIITPMLKQLKATQHGAPKVDLEDVPEELRPEKLVGEYDVDENYFKRWEYVLDEMIFAFESKLTDWEDQFWKVKPEIDFDNPTEAEISPTGVNVTPLRWKTEGECDWDARTKYQERITNGFRLFGKYYEGLWD